jgi:hypothetical protein
MSEQHEEAEILHEEDPPRAPETGDEIASGLVMGNGTILDAEEIPETALVRVDRPYVAPSSQPLSERQIEILLEDVPEDQIEIRPDGIVYWPGVFARLRLTRSLGPGGWALIPLEPPTVDKEKNRVYYRGALFVGGRFFAEATGGHDYRPDNKNDSWDDALEAAKTNSLVRCCKDLGIGHELWEPSYVRRWIRENAVQVWCEGVKGSREEGKKKPFWRRKADPPIDQSPWKEPSGGGGSNPPAETRQRAQTKGSPKGESPAPAKKGLPDRPWNGETLREVLRAKIRKTHKEFGDQVAGCPIDDDDHEGLLGDLDRLWPISLGPDLMTVVLKFLLEIPEGVTPTVAQAGALNGWIASMPWNVIDREAKLVTVHLMKEALWVPADGQQILDELLSEAKAPGENHRATE